MFGAYIPYVNGVMDASAVQRNLIADNIANSNTPGYKAKKLAFESALQSNMVLSLKKDNALHAGYTGELLSHPAYNVSEDAATKARIDGNNVDTTTEMIDMIRNNYIFNHSVHAVNKDFTLYKLAIGRA